MRDGAAHLPEAIASLEAQTDPDFQVLAVDDGSTDGSREILESWAGRDRRVRVLAQEATGIVAALERARARASGRWLARADADDVSVPERFAHQRALLEDHPDVAACGTRVRYFPRRRLGGGARRYEAWLNSATAPDEVARELFVECPLAHPAFFLRAEAVAAVGGYRAVGWPEDYDLLLRLWGAGHALANVPQVLLHWREGPERLSRTHPDYAPEAFRACKIHHLRATLLQGRGVVVWGAGPVGKAFARDLLRGGVGVVAFVEVDPRKIGQVVHGAPVVDTSGGLSLTGVLHLAAVGRPGGREALRALLREGGLRELRDFVAVA